MQPQSQGLQTSFSFHFAVVESTYPESRVGGGRVGAKSAFPGHVDGDPQRGIPGTWGRPAAPEPEALSGASASAPAP